MSNQIKTDIETLEAIRRTKIELSEAKLARASGATCTEISERLNTLFACLNTEHVLTELRKAA